MSIRPYISASSQPPEHSVTAPSRPAFHARGIAGLIEPHERLLLAHTHGGLPWVAKLDIASFFDAIPHGPLLAARSTSNWVGWD